MQTGGEFFFKSKFDIIFFLLAPWQKVVLQYMKKVCSKELDRLSELGELKETVRVYFFSLNPCCLPFNLLSLFTSEEIFPGK